VIGFAANVLLHGALCSSTCASPHMYAAMMMLTSCGVSVPRRLSVEGDVLSIKVENKAEAPAPNATPNAAADDGDFAMVSAEGEHGRDGANDGGGPANDGEGASGSADVKCARLPCSFLYPCRSLSSSCLNVRVSWSVSATLFKMLCSLASRFGCTL